MTLKILITNENIEKIRTLIECQKNHPIFIQRRRYNIDDDFKISSRDDFWHTIIACLLTTQQKSSEGSPVQKFLKISPFPLNLNICGENNLEEYTVKILKNFVGIQYYNKIGKYLNNNFEWLDSGGWLEIERAAEELTKVRIGEINFQDKVLERQMSHFIQKKLKGFGPKQSRNFWQWNGYTRYEIPLDSRNIKWFNSNKIFTEDINKKSLYTNKKYEKILDSIQNLCQVAKVIPCMLDAAIFSLYENNSYNDDNICLTT